MLEGRAIQDVWILPIRWLFTETTPDSFRWTGEALAADGRTWTLEAEFRATRMR